MNGSTGEHRKGRVVAVLFVLMAPVLYVINACEPFENVSFSGAQGEEVLYLQVRPEFGPQLAPQVYSVRAYEEWFGWGRTCVGVFSRRNPDGRETLTWHADGGSYCDEDGEPDDSGWRTADVLARIGNSMEYAAIGIVPDHVAKVRITRVADKESRVVDTRKVPDLEGRYFALWQSGFLADAVEPAEFGFEPEVEVTLLDAAGKEMSPSP